MTHWRIVCKKSSCIGQFSLIVDNAKRFVVAILERAVSAIEVSGTQNGKCHVFKSPARYLTVIRQMGTFQYQFLMFRHTCYYTLVTNTYKGLHLSITDVIVRSLNTRHYIEHHKLFVFALGERQFEVGNRINVALDCLADLLRIAFCISKTNQRVVIGNAPYKFTTNAIGKSTHAFAPALWLLHLQSLLLIVFCCFAYQLANIEYFHCISFYVIF